MTSLLKSLKFNDMRRLYSVLFFVSLFVSACGPSRHAIQVEMRYPSKSGIELAGKIISVVYLVDGDAAGDNFNAAMAEGFATELEQDYGTGEGSVGIYSIKNSGGRYSDKDTLVNLLMDTGCDAVFLFDKVGMSKAGEELTKFSIKLYCFDAMNKDENVYAFGGNKVVNVSSEDFLKEAFKSGQTVAGSFKSQWKHEQYSIVYYENDKWFKALEKAAAYDWKAAMDMWIGFLSTSDMMKRSCAEYNIAVACYMLGDYELASEWLDRSDQDNQLPLSDGLRKRIRSRQESAR